MEVTVYDDGGKTIDRYTVVIGNDVYGMSDNCLSPNGFNQYCGELSEMDVGAFGEILPKEKQSAILRRAIADRLNHT